MRAMPMIDGVLPVNVTRDRNERDHEEAMRGQKVAKGKTEKAAAIQLFRVERQHDHHGEKRQEAGQHLPFRVPPVRFTFFAFNHPTLEKRVNYDLSPYTGIVARVCASRAVNVQREQQYSVIG